MATRTIRVTRRQALAMAAGGAAGAAGLRLVALHFGDGFGNLASAAGPRGAWKSPLDTPRAKAAHLLRRAGFAYTREELDSAASMEYSDLVESLLAQGADGLAAPPDPTAYQQVVQAWYAHMAVTKAQFPERMTLFWHGVLTSDYRKANRFPFVHQQNQLFRHRGRGDLRTLLTEVTMDPLMMRYLDLDRSNAKAPNENYSRELMELFTLGVGNYTESDVREGARALAGLRIVLHDKNGAIMPTPVRKGQTPQEFYAQLKDLASSGAVFQGALDPARRDTGSKTFLGRQGDLGVHDVIDAILAQDATATFLANKALVHFATPTPSAQLVNHVAGQFRDSKYDITTLMRSIFQSDEFLAASNYRSLVRSPADYMVTTMRVLNNPALAKQAATAGAGMDQILYDPPTVAGWPSNGGWLSSSSLLARINFAQTAVGATSTLPDPLAAVADQCDSIVGSDLAEVFNASHSPADRWYALLSSPEFHLK